MPYVEGGGEWPPSNRRSFLRNPEGFGTWPFGEEWLWEAVAGSYLPLLDVLQRDAPITLSLTPVLCDQLAAPGATERCLRFLREIRPESHRLDAAAFRSVGKEDLAREIERSAAEYADAADRLAALPSISRPCSGATPRGPRPRPTRSSRCWRPTPGSSSKCRPASSRTAGASATGQADSGCLNAPTSHGSTRCSRTRASGPHVSS